MLKQFFKDSATYGMGFLLVQGLSFFLLPFYTRVLTQADYGVTDLLGMVNSLANVILPLVVIGGVERFYTGTQVESEKVNYASSGLWFTAVMYSLFALACLPYAEPLARLILGSASYAPVFRLFLLATWGYGTFNHMQFQLRLMLRSKAYALVSLVSTAAAIGVTILLVLVLRLGVIGVIGGWCVQYLLGGALAWHYGREAYALRLDRRALGEMLRFSLPLVPVSLMTLTIVFVDRAILRLFMTIEDIGIFAIAHKLVTPLNNISTPISYSLNPLIFTRFKQPETPLEIARIFRYVIALSLVVFAVYSLFASEIISIIAPPSYMKAAQLLPIMVWVVIINMLLIFAPGLSIAKKTGTLALIYTIGAILSTLLNLLLVPILGILGSAVSNLLGLSALFGIRIVFSQKYYPIPYEWKRTSLALLLVVSLVVFGSFQRLPLWPGLALKCLLLLASIAVVFVLKLVEWEKAVLAWSSLQGWITLRFERKA